MSLRDKFIVRSSIGFGIGILVGTVIAALSGSAEAGDGRLALCSAEFVDFIGDEVLAFLIQTFLCGVQGMVGMGGAVAYEIEKWSTLRATVTHFCAVMLCFYAIAFFARWISPHDISGILWPLAFMVPPYVLVWLINYAIYKLQVNDINEKLNRFKSAEPKK